MTLGEFIKEYRNNHEITQKQLAEELGIPGSNSDVCRIEKGTERKLGALRARFLIYCTRGENWVMRKPNAKSLLITVGDLREIEREYLVSVILL